MGYRRVHEHVQGWITENVAGRRLLIAFLSPSFTVHTLLATTNAEHDTITLRLAQTVVEVTHGTADNMNNVHQSKLHSIHGKLALQLHTVLRLALLLFSVAPTAPQHRPNFSARGSAGVRVARQLWLLYAPQLGHHHWTLGPLRV
jgi:hypothetical protein